MDILMIHAWNKGMRSFRGRFSTLLTYPSLTLPTLVSLVPGDVNARVDVCDEISQQVSYDGKRYDVVAISFDTSSSSQAYAHAVRFRQRGSHVLLGGYHTSSMPEEAARYADSIIIGAGELSLPQFFRDFAAGAPQRVYDNQNVEARQFTVPARDVVKKTKYLKIPTLIADRGCDNRCKFCAISRMWRSNPRPIDHVIREMKELRSSKVIFFDPNFFGKKQYALELMGEIEKLNIKWAANATADFAYDDELLAAARGSGCKGVLVGLESFNTDSLNGVGKPFNDAGRYRDVVARIHDYGITVNGCFVLGFDSDTEEQLLSLPEQVRYLGLDLTRFAILTPLPGSEMFRELDQQNRIITRDWGRYNQQHAVFQPVHMSPERLEEIYLKVWEQAYSWKDVLARVAAAPTRDLQMKLTLLGANIGFKYLDL